MKFAVGASTAICFLATYTSFHNAAQVNAFSMGGWSRTGHNAQMFSPNHKSITTNARSKSARSSLPKSSSSLHMVMERLSEECIAAISTSHKIGNEFGMRLLKNELVIAGLTNRPEQAGRTLARYNLQYPLVKQSASKLLQQNGFQLVRKVNRETMTENSKPLPFSEEVKVTLTQASKIADYLQNNGNVENGGGGGMIASEHVLLALMGYNFGNPMDMENVPTGVQVFKQSEGFAVEDPTKFSSYDFCEELIADIREPGYDWTRDNPKPIETVAINSGGGASTKTNTLEEVGVDLTEQALMGKLDKVYGRDKEIIMALRTLGRRRKNNPCLIGDPGVGKTAIAEAIAQVIASSYPTKTTTTTTTTDENKKGLSRLNPFGGKTETETTTGTVAELDEEYNLPPCPKSLENFKVINVQLASLVAGTRNRGDFEEKVQNLIKEASNANIILFIDEIHNLIGTGGGGDGAMNAANLLKPALARGELRLLGATTTAEYRRYIEKDQALERRFQPLTVEEPTVEETMEILKTIEPKYAEYHGVEYTENALDVAARLSDRYITDRFLPDKAIDLLDEAGSMIKMDDNFDEDYFVTEDAITQVISEISGIPVGRLDTGEKTRLRNLELEMGQRIKGQERAVKSVAKAIRRARSGMRDPKRPVASFLFCGPTGVGKTELCKSLADTYYGREKDMITIDMSEYMDRFSTSRLVGAPPGYVGYDEGGQLTEAVRRNPHSVILFDEVEKAHEDVLNILLQIMDEGKLTDGKGRAVNFKNAIFVMTSNIGSNRILEVSKETSGETMTQSLEMAKVVQEELEKTWKPELLNRIDEIVVFSPLSMDNLRAIATNILEDTAERAGKSQNIEITVGEDVATAVTREGMQFSAQYGARPIRRATQRYLEDTMSEAIMKDFIREGDVVTVEMASVTEMNGVELSEDQNVVQISKLSPMGRRDTLLVPVEAEAGIGGATQNDAEWQALYGDLPTFDDDSQSPPKEDGPSFQ